MTTLLDLDRALTAVQHVLTRYEPLKGDAWRGQSWLTHTRHAVAHGQTAILAEDRGGEFADKQTELEHQATRGLFALQQYLEEQRTSRS